MKKRYAVVGTGGRVGGMFLEPLAGKFRDEAELVAFCDPSPTRMQYHVETLRNGFGSSEKISLYAPDDFDLMLQRERPDTVIVCSVDATHADYIIRSLKAGCDVIVEKPIAINLDQCKAIQEAAEKSGNQVLVAFNYRWSPAATKVREVLASGAIGVVQHVNFEYFLDTSHGADYFRRWHCHMAQSGGLLVHKASHHFDLANWWVDGIPATVSAHGGLMFYGRANAIGRNEEHLTRYDRYLDPASVGDPFRLDLLAEDSPARLYHAAEGDSGYIRDRNVFRDDIDIYDTMSLTATYRSGTLLTYSLVAYAPYEGFKVSFTGDRGRIEYTEIHGSHLITGQSDAELAQAQAKIPSGLKPYELVLHPHFQDRREIEVPVSQGGHSGADPVLQEQLFSSQAPPDVHGRRAGWRQGIAATMLGICANLSIKEERSIRISDHLALNPEAIHLSDLG